MSPMFSLKEFRWTSRADLCRAISATLKSEAVSSPGTGGSSGDADPSARFRRKSIHLLSAPAGEEAVPFLTQVLACSREHCTSRDAAYRALCRLKTQIDPEWWIEWVDSVREDDPHGLDFAGMALSLCAPDEALLHRLRSANGKEIEALGAALLAAPSRRADESYQQVLLERWLDAWRAGEYARTDVAMARRLAREFGLDEPLVALGAKGSPDRLYSLVWHTAEEDADTARRLADKLGVRQAMADKLMLPPALLVEQFGTAECGERFRNALSEAAAHLVNHRCPAEVHGRMGRTLRLLTGWPDTAFDGLFIDYLLSPDLESIRPKLVKAMWHRNTETAWALGMQAADGHGPPSLAAEVASLGALDPPAEAERLFCWAVEHGSGRPQAHSMIALEHLGYDTPEWRRRLTELANQTYLAVRFHARAALGRRGEDAWLAEVIERAEQDPSEDARAEALRALGDTDPERYLPVLGRSFMEDHSPDDVCCSPGAEAASNELARWGTPDAMTFLVRGVYRVTTSCLFSGVMSHLHAFAARRPGFWDLSPYGRANHPSVRDRTVVNRPTW